MNQYVQPSLFSSIDLPPIPPDEVRRGGRSAIRKLRAVQRLFSGNELAYCRLVDECAAKILSVSRLSDNQREQLVLIAVERQGCSTAAEISEDTRIDRPSVEKIVLDLRTRGILYLVRKKGSSFGGAKTTLIKSRRVGVPEAD